MKYDQPHILIEKALDTHDCVLSLIKLLNNENTAIEAALNLSEIKDERALPFIVEKFKENKKIEFAYCLTQFNCENYLVDLVLMSFDLPLSHQQHMLEIINGTYLNKEQLLNVKNIIENKEQNTNNVISMTHKNFMKNLLSIYKLHEKNLKIKSYI